MNMHTRLYVDMYSKSPVCKTTSKQDYNSISLNVCKSACLLVYIHVSLQKIIFSKKQKKNQRKMNKKEEEGWYVI